jgi:hypothetical protein
MATRNWTEYVLKTAALERDRSVPCGAWATVSRRKIRDRIWQNGQNWQSRIPVQFWQPGTVFVRLELFMHQVEPRQGEDFAWHDRAHLPERQLQTARRYANGLSNPGHCQRFSGSARKQSDETGLM